MNYGIKQMTYVYVCIHTYSYLGLCVCINIIYIGIYPCPKWGDKQLQTKKQNHWASSCGVLDFFSHK